MNKLKGITFSILLSLLLCGCVTNNQPQDGNKDDETVIPEPEEEEEDFSDYVEISQEGKMLFARGNVGQKYIGDPMPYYENGKMYIYYLEDARNYRGPFHPISMLETSDFMHYEFHDRVIPFESGYNDPDYALGTGSCIKDKNNKYHFFYTGHNSNSNTGLLHVEKIQHAISDDMIHWTKLNDGFYGDVDDFRDPHVVYIAEKDEYWLLVSQFKNVLGTLEKYVSKDLSSWTHEGTFYRNSKGYYNMECSTLIHHKGYWYLSFSEQGDNRVVHYRYKKNLSDDWIVPSNDKLDDIGFYAGKMAGDENRLFIYGWNGTKSRSNDGNAYAWGGNLVGHELIQLENGELSVNPIKEVSLDISHRYPHQVLESEEIVTSFINDENGYHALAFKPFKDNRFSKMSFDYIPKGRGGSAGIMLNITDKESSGSLAFEFNNANNEVNFYNKVTKDGLGEKELSMPFSYTTGEKIHCDLYYEDQVTVLYVDGQIALSARTYALKNKPFSLYANSKRCVYENIRFYE